MPVKPLYAECLKDCCSGDSTDIADLKARLSKLEENAAKLATKEEVSTLDKKVETLKEMAVTEDELEIQADFNGTPRTQTVKLKENTNDQ